MPASATWARPEDLVESLSSLDNTARLKALRDVKNQIIGNKTKKLSYIKLGAVPRVVEILASDTEIPLLVQSAAALGSFACGIDAGVRAVLDSGVLPHLLKMLQNGDSKVAETCARALKMIFHSPLAPKSDMFQGHRMELLLQLLNHENENVSEVAARVLARCCETKEHQQALADAGGLQSLVSLLAGSIKIREAALDALAALTKHNKQISETLIKMNNGEDLASIIRLIKDKSPLTRLLACMCLVNIGKACPAGYAQDGEVRANMLRILMKLLEVPGQVGEDAPGTISITKYWSIVATLTGYQLLKNRAINTTLAPGVLADLVANNEELQKTAADQNAVEKLADFLLREEVPSKQLEGVLWGLSELCSRLEESRRQLLELQDWKSLNTSFALAAPFLLRRLVQGSLIAALRHSCEGVKVAACACVRSLSRSVKNLRTSLTSEQFVRPLLLLMNDPSPAVQAEALTAVGNIVLDFTLQKSVIMKTDGIIQLINLAVSMDHNLRRNAVLALKNLLFMSDITVKRRVMAELTVSTLCDLIRDPEEDVQEQAITLVRNLVYGDPESVEQIFSEGGMLFQAIEKQLINPRPEISVQALYVMCNVASGSEVHKDAVLTSILTSQSTNNSSWLTRFLQDMSNPPLRVVAVWCIVNLLYPAGDGIGSRAIRLQEAGVEAQLHKMVDDSCLDVKNHVKTALEYFMPATVTTSSGH